MSAPFIEQGKISYNAGECGGDTQASDAVSRRFIRDNTDGTFTIIDVMAWVTDQFMSEDRAPEDRFWDVDVCTYVGNYRGDISDEVNADEIGADFEYADRGSVLMNGTTRKREALLAARRYVRNIDPIRDLS